MINLQLVEAEILRSVLDWTNRGALSLPCFHLMKHGSYDMDDPGDCMQAQTTLQSKPD